MNNYFITRQGYHAKAVLAVLFCALYGIRYACTCTLENLPTRWITIGRESAEGTWCSGWQIEWLKCWSLPLCIEKNTLSLFIGCFLDVFTCKCTCTCNTFKMCPPAHAIWIICLAVPGSIGMADIAWVVWKGGDWREGKGSGSGKKMTYIQRSRRHRRRRSCREG